MGRFIEGADRRQTTLLPDTIDDYVGEENPVRVIDAFVEMLDLAALGLEGVIPEDTGRPSYHPATLLKIYVYGYLNQVQSSRGLERAQERLDERPNAMIVRRSAVEHPFGSIKAWMGPTHFRMKTLQHVATEMALHVLGYNLKRVMAILGVRELLRAMSQAARRRLTRAMALAAGSHTGSYSREHRIRHDWVARRCRDRRQP